MPTAGRWRTGTQMMDDRITQKCDGQALGRELILRNKNQNNQNQKNEKISYRKTNLHTVHRRADALFLFEE